MEHILETFADNLIFRHENYIYKMRLESLTRESNGYASAIITGYAVPYIENVSLDSDLDLGEKE